MPVDAYLVKSSVHNRLIGIATSLTLQKEVNTLYETGTITSFSGKYTRDGQTHTLGFATVLGFVDSLTLDVSNSSRLLAFC